MALSITSLLTFFENEQKSISRGENHYKSKHVESFLYVKGVMKGKVHASMKKKVYNVTVSNRHFLRPVFVYFKIANTK